MHLVLALVRLCGPSTAADRPYLCAPAMLEYARHDPDGTTILANGRYLRPLGGHAPVARWPHGLTASPDGETLFIANAGVGQLVSGWRGAAATTSELIRTVGATTGRSNSGASASSSDARTLYWSGGYVDRVEACHRGG